MLANEESVDVKVFYTWEQSRNAAKYDPGFGKVIEWDIPLLEGYEHTFVKNVSKSPGSHSYKGIVNPTLNTDIEAWGAEAVLVFGWPFHSHLRCLKYFKRKIPVLFRGDSTLLDEQKGLKRVIRRILLKYVYSFIDYALYVGENNKKYFLAHGVKEKQLHFVPHAIDSERFSAHATQYEQDAQELRRELGISENAFVILFAGKFINKKDPFFMLKLAELLKDEDVDIVMVGNGELESELKQKASGIRVHFMDFQNQGKMPVIYRMCDLFVLPSKGPNETWGLVINEAVACGKYVIATDKVGCAPDMIKSENGLVVNVGDVDMAANYVKSIIRKEDSRIVMKNRNKVLTEKYSYDSIVSSINQILRKIESGE